MKYLLNIKYLCFIAIFSAAITYSCNLISFEKGDGKISIFNYHERKYAEIRYKDAGRYVDEGLKQVDEMLCSRDGKVRRMDIRLVELLDHIQDHFGAETVEAISCYRSPAYNKQLKMFGRGVADESLHTIGMACDIHLDEVREEDLFEYVKGLKAGGVGLYSQSDFVHVDMGKVRTWSEPAPNKRVLVGTENNPNSAWTAVTDKNEYGVGDAISVVITNNDYIKKKFSPGRAWLERLRKGDWSEHNKVDISGSSKRLKTAETTKVEWNIPEGQPYGKYRFVIFPSGKEDPMYSNEFYVKRP